MRTNYGAPGYSRRYQRSRRLAPVVQKSWAAELAMCTSGVDVKVIADVGAGTGRFWSVFAAAWEPRVILALDVSLPMLWAGGDSPGVQRVAAHMDALPLSDESIDVCFCSMVLHYSEDAVATLAGLQRHLKRGGVVIVRTGTSETLSSFDFLKYFPTALAAEIEAMPAQSDVEEWVRSAGFIDVASRSIEISDGQSRVVRLLRVFARGFPSLQFVGKREFILGATRYAIASAKCALQGRAPAKEGALLVVGRRGSVDAPSRQEAESHTVV